VKSNFNYFSTLVK